MSGHVPRHLEQHGPGLELRNRVTSRSVLHYVDANYQHSSHSLVDTQYTTDDSKHNWRLGSSYNLNMDAVINSRCLPRTSRCYYLQAGNLDPKPNDDTTNTGRVSHPVLDKDDSDISEYALPSPPSPSQTAARPDWRAHAYASGRAGSYYDYSVHPEHLRDRLFYQAQLLPPDVALQGATTQALQDYAALEIENKVLERVVGEKEARVTELSVAVRLREGTLAMLMGGREM